MWELDYKENWAPKNWCFWIVMLEKALLSLLDFKGIKRVNPKGNQPWILIGRTDAETPILWPPDVKNWLLGKDPDAGKDWRQEEKGTTEDEMVGWYHYSYICLSKLQELVMDRKAWHAAFQGVAMSWTWLSNFHFYFLSLMHLSWTPGINLLSGNPCLLQSDLLISMWLINIVKSG